MADAKRGAETLDEHAAKRPTLKGPLDLIDRVEKRWRAGMPPGDRTGWRALDELYTVAPGMLTIVTGYPSSGKSAWVDALAVNLALQGWRFAIFSPEMQPTELHIALLLEKLSGKPFGAGPTERMSLEEMREYADDLQQRFVFMDAPQDSLSIRSVVELADHHFSLSDDDSKRGLIIDPWNEFEHLQPSGMTETQYISLTLAYVKAWARRTQTHVWIIAHPKIMPRSDGGKLQIPRPDSINGGANWWNKADAAICVNRQLDQPTADVDIHVQKMKWKHLGKPGMVTLNYDRITGRYHEPFKGFTRVVNS